MRNHQKAGLSVLVAGSSPFAGTVLFELLEARASASGSGKIGSVTAAIGDTGRDSAPRSGVSFVSGNPADPAVLAKAGSKTADVIVVTSYGAADAERETGAILEALARPEASPKTGATVTATGRSPDSFRSGAPARVHCVESVFTRIIAQSARQRGLARVYRELLSFHGNDFYLVPGRDLAGMTFSRCLRAFANACPVGIRSDGRTRLNPPMTCTIGPDDELVILARSLSDVMMNPAILPVPDEGALSREEIATTRQEAYLFLGWNRLCPDILAEINEYSHRDSVAGVSAEGAEILEKADRFSNLSLRGLEGPCRDDRFIAGIPWEYWENVVLPGTAETGDESAVELLSAVRASLATRGFENNLTAVSWGSDGRETLDDVLSVTIAFRILAQLALNPDLTGVITEITSPAGAEIYLKPAENYVLLDKPCDFYTILEAAKRKGETAVGYVKHGERVPILNPIKAAKERFGHFDRIVVLADEN